MSTGYFPTSRLGYGQPGRLECFQTYLLANGHVRQGYPELRCMAGWRWVLWFTGKWLRVSVQRRFVPPVSWALPVVATRVYGK